MHRLAETDFLPSLVNSRGVPRDCGVWHWLLAITTLWMLCASPGLRAQGLPTEYEVKAAYLYQFGKFVEWPEGTPAHAGDEFAICTIGTDPFGPVLDETISGRDVQGKKVIAKRLTSVSEASDCNILFVGSSEQSRLAEVLKTVQGKGILTVGDKGNFLEQGGMIQFQVEQNRVRFEINLPAVERSNLKLSSQLLKVAKVVNE